ncbi:odorant receptor 94b-like [Anastrepha ludens]|uniref:odorant receptor 94b-like n=1 Tax=Anastrepha ludens TaxID=28586 RepID=UPI0023AFA791|nr:odorant receptor 94b-like [Anastrepha ludens]
MDRLQELSFRIFPSDPAIGQIGSLQYNVWLAQLFGVPIVGLKAESPSMRAALVVYGFLATLVVTFLYTGFEIYDLILCWPDLDILTQNICLSLTHVAGVIKVVNIIYRLDDIAIVVRKIEYAAKTYVISKNQLKEFLRDEFKNKIPLTIYASLVGFTAVLGIIYLFYNPKEVAGRIFPYRVKLPDWMPFGMQLVYMGLSVLVVALQIVAVDYLNVTMINQIRCQLNILNLAFDEFKLGFEAKEGTMDSREINPENKLRAIIEHHCLLIELRNEVEAIFRMPLLIQFFTSLVIFAMTGFQANVKAQDPDGASLIYCYCGCIFCELFFYCWFGNEVSEQSKTLATSGYGSPWYEFDQRFKNSLLLFLSQSQEPFVFTAGGFISLSLPSFSGILSKSYSFIAFLRQVYGR